MIFFDFNYGKHNLLLIISCEEKKSSRVPIHLLESKKMNACGGILVLSYFSYVNSMLL